MYIRSIKLSNLRAFAAAKIEFLYPGRSLASDPFTQEGRECLENPRFRNVNVILGANGSGKSSILDAIAIAMMSPIAQNGFRPNALIRRSNRGKVKQADIKLDLVLHGLDSQLVQSAKGARQELDCKIASEGDYEFLSGPNSSNPNFQELFFERSPAFALFGYGVFRRVEAHSHGELQSRSKIRHPRYDRVVTLFEDGVPLIPLSSWIPGYGPKERRDEIIQLINKLTPRSIRFEGKFDRTAELIFTYNGLDLPFSALSDGYKGHLGWIGDLLFRLQEITPPHMKIAHMPAVVLVDEIDAHLHPAWQQEIIGVLSRTLPKVQFILTTHSPLVTGTLERANTIVVSRKGGFAPVAQAPEEEMFGLSADQILTTDLFGLDTTRDIKFASDLRNIGSRMVEGEAGASVKFMRMAAIGKAAENVSGKEAPTPPDWLVAMATKK